jgi:gliding motility-associated-like protein
MKKTFLIITVVLNAAAIQAQKQCNIWYFGSGCGLDFSSGTPIMISNGRTGSDIPFWDSQEGTSCISDSTGNILFYTGGKTIWNRHHAPMPHGTGLLGGTSSTQSSLIVPLPGSENIFYVFTSDEYQNMGANGYRYSVVNMCLENGLGDVISHDKNILLCGPSTEKLSACADAAGTGYWITGHKMYSDEFYSWHLTSAGITDTVISQIGTLHGWDNVFSIWRDSYAQGEMKFNQNGTKLALAISKYDPAYLDLFDFDNNTGIVSNFCHFVIDSAVYARIWGVEFSPDGSKLYATLSGGSGGKKVYQFDINAGGGDCDSIKASRYLLFQSFINGVMTGIKSAPDGKIYLIGNTYYDLCSIDFPNVAGSGAGFNLSAVNLSGQNNYELPNMIAGCVYYNTITNNNIIPLFDTIPTLCLNSSSFTLPTTSLNNPPITGSWNMPVTTTNIGTTTYSFISDPNTCAVPLNIDITVIPPFIIPDIELPSELCQFGAVPMLPLVSINGISGTWNGSINTSIPGNCEITFIPDINQCAEQMPLNLNVLPRIQPEFIPLGPFCKDGINVQLPNQTINNPPFQGSWDKELDISQSGTQYFIFTPDSDQCAMRDTIEIVIQDSIRPEKVSFDIDNVSCGAADGKLTFIDIIGGTAPYWTSLDSNEFSSSTSYTNLNAGYHLIKIIDSFNCLLDSFAIINTEEANSIYCPNGFTPNGDGINDEWKVYYSCIKKFTCSIFDRWGEEVYTLTEKNNSWNGLNSSNLVMESVYIYKLEGEFFSGEKFEKRGTILAIR